MGNAIRWFCSFGLAFALILGACAQSGEGGITDVAQSKRALDPVTKSGTRLELRSDTTTFTSVDGAEYTYRSDPYFYDTELKKRCDMVVFGSGRIECQPPSEATVDGTYPGQPWSSWSGPTATLSSPSPIIGGTSRAFFDSACRDQLATFYDPTGTIDASKVILRKSTDITVYSLGTERTSALGGSIFYQLNSLAPCDLLSTSSLTRGYRYFEIAGPMANIMTFTRTTDTVTLP